MPVRTHLFLIVLVACHAATPAVEDTNNTDTETAPAPVEDPSHYTALDEDSCAGAAVPWEVVGAGPSTTYELSSDEQDLFNPHKSALLRDTSEAEAWIAQFGSPDQPVDLTPWTGRAFIGVWMEGSADNSEVVLDCLYATGEDTVGLIVHTLEDSVNGYSRAWLLVAVDPRYVGLSESYWTVSECTCYDTFSG